MNNSIKGYRWDEIETSSEEVGIYSWYLCPEIRESDVVDADRTKQSLLRIARQVKFPDMTIAARGHLSLSLSGDLHHDCLGSAENDEISKLVDEVINKEETRSLFTAILKGAMPCYMSPLYIGVTSNIRKRLTEHKDNILRLRRLTNSYDLNLKEHYSQKFALEIVSRGIPNSSLIAFTQSLPKDLVATDLARKSIEAVETVLNRMFFPVLGRR